MDSLLEKRLIEASTDAIRARKIAHVLAANGYALPEELPSE